MSKQDSQPIMTSRRTKLRPYTYIVLTILTLYLFITPATIRHPFPANANLTSEWPYTPFHTNDTQIVNALNQPVTLVGINWPGHGLPMVPEGLQYQSIRDIVSKVKDLGMNVVRLTYATEMVDSVYTNGGLDVKLKDSFVHALGQENGTKVYESVVRLNPELGDEWITRLDVFDAVAEELARQHIYVHLDNHISKAGWCCSLIDENGFFGDKYFNTTNWVRGLKFMADHASHWRAFISTSLRNELRNTLGNPTIAATYNWTTWYDNIIPAIDAVHSTNNNTLIFVSGLEFDRTLGPAINGEDLGSYRRFNLSALPGSQRDKIVWEIHNYNNTITNCDLLEKQLNDGGYNILTHTTPVPATANIAPIVLSEFGFPQDNDGMDSVYAQCLSSLLQRVRGGWMYWVIAGSYYEREGVQDFDESWGILSKDWSRWRSQEVVYQYFGPLVDGVLGHEGSEDGAE